MQITPFRIAISDAQIDDLKARLEGTRWPVATTTDWSRGQPVPFIRELAEQWLKSYDWRQHEAKLNAWPQFLAEIDGQTVHFLHVKSKEPGTFPLILTHGWPSTIYEFIDVIGPLTDPRAHGLDPKLAFDLVIPSIPGYGFSSPLTAPGWDSARTARAWAALMQGLGYTRYGAQGGDLLGAGLAGVGPLLELGRVVLRGDHRDRQVVAPVVGEGEPVGHGVQRRRDRALADARAQVVVEVGDHLVVEEVPRRQRHVVTVDREHRVRLLGDARLARQEHHARDAVEPRVGCCPGDDTAHGVTHDQRLRPCGKGVELAHDGIDVLLPGDARSVVGDRLHAGQGERVGGVPGLLQQGHDVVPRSCGQPEARDEDDVHAATLGEPTDSRTHSLG